MSQLLVDTATMPSVSTELPPLPSWRGRLHLITLMVAIPTLVLLAIDAEGARARTGVVIYAVGLSAMFGVSTMYHRWARTPRARAIWRRADHATIFVAIAATCTPVCLLVGGPAAIWVLVGSWVVAAIGITAEMRDGTRAAKVGRFMYIANGWLVILILPPLWSSGHETAALLLIGGGVVYTVGAVFFARSWPQLWPDVFGYHEAWHVATVTGASAHLAAIWLLTT